MGHEVNITAVREGLSDKHTQALVLSSWALWSFKTRFLTGQGRGHWSDAVIGPHRGWGLRYAILA